ncbi:MAG: glycosyltransferase [Pirellulales bacterium]|nr:glycosyltransferase [Pirellulales bacterium]
MKKRILQIIPTLDRAGAEKQMCLLAGGLARDEFDVRVCALTRGGPLSEDLRRAGVPTTVIGKRCKLDPLAFWRLRQHVAELKPDLVHTWIFAADAYGRVAGMFAGVPAMVTGLRCVDPWKSGLQLALDRLLARRTARLVANSPGVRDFYVEKGLPAEKIEVIANGVEPAGPVRTTRRQILAELGLPEDSRLVGLVGRLWAQKRVKDAIWAADLLKVIRKDVHLLIVGDGPQRRQLVRYRDQIEIADKVHFLGERPDVARLLPHFDALWSTSGYEGQSNTVMEAMAAAVPVVATDVPGTRDLVVHGETGYLVPVGDRAGFARHTNRLLDDAALAARLGQAARQRMAEHFAVAAMIDRHADLYRRVLEK